MECRQRVLGGEHIDTLCTLGGVGELRMKMGELQAA
eukprot:SAG22_NODE_14200_length_382_cov_0.710247_1_plen_35_part_01